MCESRCPYDESFLGECNHSPEEKSCEAQGDNPIDFSSGDKLRREPIITLGVRDTISLTYYYDNYNNHEKTAAGFLVNKLAANTLIASSTRIPLATYTAQYNEKGLLKSTVSSHQYYGSIEQYWRHNFDDVLLIRGNVYQLHLANGETHTFNGLGESNSHPAHALLALSSSEEDYSGYKWVHHKTGKEKRFDSTGKLRKVIYSPAKLLTLTYLDNKLTRIENNIGEALTFEYAILDTDSIYAQTHKQHFFPNKVTSDEGKIAILEWNHNFVGQTATFPMLTRITEAVAGTPNVARDFNYTDTRWPASITEINTVTDINQNTQKLYAEFRYDDQGRAIYSSLANGVEAVTVNYVDALTRTVTNALGKDATYSFAMVDGVKRLAKVVGEPSSNCLRSEVEYIYNTTGTVFEKIQNNKTTRYTRYDSKNRELERVEAFGTPEAKTIKTQWHPTLNKKAKIIDPKTTTVWEYFDNGQLKSTKTLPTTAN